MERKFDLSGVKVHIGIPAYADMRPQTALAIADTAIRLTREGVLFNIASQTECCYVDLVRCYIANEFLLTPATHLFMIDSDMGWKADDFIRVLAHATVADCVAATYRMRRDEEMYAVNLTGEIRVNEYGCIPATGMGLGFCCVQRHVIEELARRAPMMRTADHPGGIKRIFRCDVTDDNWYRGEDIAFFSDLVEAGFSSWLDLGVDLDHHGRKVYRGSFLKLLQAYQTNGGTKQGTPGKHKTTVWRPIVKPVDTPRNGWKFPSDVEGWLTESEAKKLAVMAQDKEVVEIGSYYGRSTAAIAQTAKRVVSIDWHRGDYQTGPTNTLAGFKETLSRYGIADKVDIRVGKTEDVAPTLPDRCCDLLLIDGAHDERHVRIDATTALRLIRPGGMIAVHDRNFPEVQRVTDEIFGEPVSVIDGLALFQPV